MQNICRSTKLSQSSVQLFLQRGLLLDDLAADTAQRGAGLVAEPILLHRRGGTRSVSKLLGEARIPVSQRAAVPVLRDGAGPLAVYGIGQSERAFPAPQEPFYKITISPISEEERE